MRHLLIFASVLALCGCTAENSATSALIGAGYTDIHMTGYKPFSCGQDDTFATGFTATGPTGHQVRGVVCSGLLKGNTIRTF